MSLDDYCKRLRKNDPSLDIIDVEDCGLENGDFRSLANALRRTKSPVRIFFLGKNTMGLGGIKALAAVLPKLVELEILQFNNEKLGKAGVKVLAPVLPSLPNLQRLSLSGWYFQDKGAKVLAPHLAKLPKLEMLYLQANEIGDEGIQALSLALPCLLHLSTISFHDNRLTAASMPALGSALAKLKNLDTVSLNANRIGDAGVAALMPGLSKCSSLRELYIHANAVGDAGLQSLAKAMVHFPQLYELDLGNNKISDDGVKALVQGMEYSDSLVTVDLEDTKVSNAMLMVLNEILQANETGTRKKKAADPDGSPFFIKLLERDDRPIQLKLNELFELIEDVHQLKMFYTAVASCHRLGLVTRDERVYYTKQGLDESWKHCKHTVAIVMFKLVLEKAEQDGLIDRASFLTYDDKALVTRIEHAPFIKSMQASIRSNTRRIKGLEGNVKAMQEAVVSLEENIRAVNDSVTAIKKGIRYKQRVEATMGFFGAVINAVSMGIGGNLLVAFEKTIASIVDFGDVAHLQSVAASVGDIEVAEYFQMGIEMAASNSDSKLNEAAKNDNVFVVLSAAAFLIQPHSKDQVPGTVVSGGDGANMVGVADKEEEVDLTARTKAASAGTVLFEDAVLEDEDEETYPMHAAVKFGDDTALSNLLRSDKSLVNEIDSRGRTAMDLCALTGQIALMELLECKGGAFKYKNSVRMKATAKRRASQADAYLEQVLKELEF